MRPLFYRKTIARRRVEIARYFPCSALTRFALLGLPAVDAERNNRPMEAGAPAAHPGRRRQWRNAPDALGPTKATAHAALAQHAIK